MAIFNSYVKLPEGIILAPYRRIGKQQIQQIIVNHSRMLQMVKDPTISSRISNFRIFPLGVCPIFRHLGHISTSIPRNSTYFVHIHKKGGSQLMNANFSQLFLIPNFFSHYISSYGYKIAINNAITCLFWTLFWCPPCQEHP